MLSQYLPILLFLVISSAIGIALVIAGKVVSGFLGANRPSDAKLSPFECGFDAFEDARMKFDVRFYLVAILFIIFDLEVAYLFPWSVVLHKIGWYGFWAMGLFLFLLIIGFIFEWKKGALEWE